MLFVSTLTEEEKTTLNEAHKYHPLSSSRTRAHCILLSSKGYKIKEIASICNVCRQTVSQSIHAWNEQGVIGLFDEPRSGRPRKLTEAQEAELLGIVSQKPRAWKKVLSEFTEVHQIEISVDTLKRLCKKANVPLDKK